MGFLIIQFFKQFDKIHAVELSGSSIHPLKASELLRNFQRSYKNIITYFNNMYSL